MSKPFTESIVEKAALAWLESLDCVGADIVTGEPTTERQIEEATT